MSIDKWRSVIFDEDEIDFIADAIEKELFGTYLSTRNTLLSIHCLAGDNESHLMDCFNHPEHWLKAKSAHLERRSFAKIFYILGDTTPGYGVLANQPQLTGDDVDFIMTVINIDYGTVITSAIADAGSDRDEATAGIYGLNLVMTRLLEMRNDNSAGELYRKIQSSFIESLNAPEQLFRDTDAKVEKLFT